MIEGWKQNIGPRSVFPWIQQLRKKLKEVLCSVPHSGKQRSLRECVGISYSKEQMLNYHFRKGWGKALLHQRAEVRNGWSNSTDDIWKVWIHGNPGVVQEMAMSSSYSAHLLTVNILWDTLHISCKRWMSWRHSLVEFSVQLKRLREIEALKASVIIIVKVLLACIIKVLKPIPAVATLQSTWTHVLSYKKKCFYHKKKDLPLAGICAYIFIFHNVCDGCVSGSGTSCTVDPWLNKVENTLPLLSC